MNLNKLFKKIIFILFLPLGIIISYLASKHHVIIESLYSNKIYRFIGQALSKITGILPFSLGEILIYLIILFFFLVLINTIYRVIKIRNGRIYILLNFFMNTLTFISIAYFTFIIIWGLNYHRLPFSAISGLDTRPASVNELVEVCDNLIERGNTLRSKINVDSSGVMDLTYSNNKVFTNALRGYEKASYFYPELSGHYGKPKGVILSKGMSLCGISGMYFPFTCEANVNIEIPDSMLPCTTSHEMAHQRGFAREDEANFIAYVTCSLHPDIQFRYSGTLLALIHSMNTLYKYDKEEWLKLRSKYSQGIIKDLNYINEFWKSYEGPVEKTSQKLNNAYLKSNYQEDGIHSYGRMVDLLIAEYRQKNKSD